MFLINVCPYLRKKNFKAKLRFLSLTLGLTVSAGKMGLDKIEVGLGKIKEHRHDLSALT